MDRIGLRVGDDDGRRVLDHDRAVSDVQRSVDRAIEPLLGLEELADVVNEGHQPDRNVADLCCQLREAIECSFRVGVQEPEAVERGKACAVCEGRLISVGLGRWHGQ